MTPIAVPPLPTGDYTAGRVGLAPEHVAPVLVVDDRPEVSGAIADLCRGLGALAVVSTQGESVRSMLLRYRPGGVIVDVMMPDEDGYEALKEVAAYDPELPVLLMTGHGETWLRMGAVLGRAHGLTRVRTSRKPIRGAVIVEFLELVKTRGATAES